MSWTHKGVEIDVTVAGRFAAYVGEAEVSAATLIEAKELIDKELASQAKAKLTKLKLPVVGILFVDGSAAAYGMSKTDFENLTKMRPYVFATSVTGINRTTRELQFNPALPKGTKLAYIIADTPQNRARSEAVMDLVLRFRAMESELQGVRLDVGIGYGRIDLPEYESRLTKLKERHAATSKLPSELPDPTDLDRADLEE